MTAKRLILPFALFAILSASCSKTDEQPSGEKGFDRHPTWTQEDSSAFWNKQQNDGFQIDTAWDGDTTINF